MTSDSRALLQQLHAIRSELSAEATAQFEAWRPHIRRAAFEPSALNLAYYLALRRRDLRELQLALMPLGLSSLGRCESHVVPNLDAVIAALGRATGEADPRPYPTPAEFFAGQTALGAAAEELLGKPTPGRSVRIMATLPTEAGADPSYVRRLLAAGANVVRINCAHDDEETWRAMAANTRAAAKELNADVPGIRRHRRPEAARRARARLRARTPDADRAYASATGYCSAMPMSSWAKIQDRLVLVDPAAGFARSARRARVHR